MRPASLAPLAPFALLALLALPLHAQQAITHQELRPGVHLFAGYANGNVLAVEHEGSLLLVDAQSAKRVEELDAALRAVTDLPVRWVVNTHYHEDHTGGNAHWRSLGAVTVAHEAVPVQARKDTVIAAWNDWHRTPLPAAAMPMETVGDSLVLPPAILVHPSAAHTDGDLFVYFPASNVLHLGDVLERGAPPFVDWWAGGTLEGMIAAVDRALAMTDARTIHVPGHGTPTDREGLQRYRQMLVEVRDAVAAAIAAGEDPAGVAALGPAAAWEDDLGGARRAEQFVRMLAVGLGAGG